MQQQQTINLADQLRGMPVREEGAEQMLGRLADIVIHPTEGTMLGIDVHTIEGKTLRLAINRFCLNAAGIITEPGTIHDLDSLSGPLSGGAMAYGEMIGASVVTEEGKLLGRISEIHLRLEHTETFRVVYRVSGSLLERFFANRFFIPGDITQAYSRAGARLIVPARTKELYAVPWLGRKLELRQRGTLSTGKY